MNTDWADGMVYDSTNACQVAYQGTRRGMYDTKMIIEEEDMEEVEGKE